MALSTKDLAARRGASPEPRVVGLLGGMSWPSSEVYYREINRAVQARRGGSHSARVLLWSDDYRTVEQMQLAGDWAGAGELLASAARRLEAGGADLLAIACNTMHRVAAAVREASNLPFIDLVEATAREVQRHGISRAVVLGTGFTLDLPLYPERLRAHGIEPMRPAAGDRALLDRLIYDELCVGVVTDGARRRLAELIERAVDQGANGVVLACTELGLIADRATVAGAPIVDSTQAHIAALVDASLEPLEATS
ncbi:MAG: aspartate/glutamate racemase family protein [Acidobacteriota bacterium]